MSHTKTYNNTTYNVPDSNDTGWADLTDFLDSLADNTQVITKQKFGRRAATTTPVTVTATTDCYVGVNVASASVVNLPTGVNGQIFIIADESGAAGTNNITIVGTVDGAVNPVINTNYGSMRIYSNGTAFFTI